jgi:hypothetical protein
MWERVFSPFYRYKLATTILSLSLLIALWYLFRPELLFIDKKVNESPPFQTTAELLDTGLHNWVTNDLGDPNGKFSRLSKFVPKKLQKFQDNESACS